MLFCNLTPLDGRFVNAIVFCRKSEFCENITSLHIQNSIYIQFEFFVFTMKQVASISCNFSFAGQYIMYKYRLILIILEKGIDFAPKLKKESLLIRVFLSGFDDVSVAS